MKPRLFLLLILTVVWLVPFFWAGWMKRLPFKVYPRLSFQYSAAGLFTQRIETWTQMLIQVQHNGSTDWTTLDTAELSPMGAFGYRQRLDRILQETQGRKVADVVKPRLAAWLAQRYGELHPGQGNVTAVRFAQTLWPANSPELAQPAGHWQPNPPLENTTAQFRELAAYTIANGSARLILPPARAPAPESAPPATPGRRFRPAAPSPLTPGARTS